MSDTSLILFVVIMATVAIFAMTICIAKKKDYNDAVRELKEKKEQLSKKHQEETQAMCDAVSFWSGIVGRVEKKLWDTGTAQSEEFKNGIDANFLPEVVGSIVEGLQAEVARQDALLREINIALCEATGNRIGYQESQLKETIIKLGQQNKNLYDENGRLGEKLEELQQFDATLRAHAECLEKELEEKKTLVEPGEVIVPMEKMKELIAEAKPEEAEAPKNLDDQLGLLDGLVRNWQ